MSDETKLRNHALSDQACIRCNSKKHTVSECQHSAKKLYTEQDMQELLRKQRESCAEVFLKRSKEEHGFADPYVEAGIFNAPSTLGE